MVSRSQISLPVATVVLAGLVAVPLVVSPPAAAAQKEVAAPQPRIQTRTQVLKVVATPVEAVAADGRVVLLHPDGTWTLKPLELSPGKELAPSRRELRIATDPPEAQSEYLDLEGRFVSSETGFSADGRRYRGRFVVKNVGGRDSRGPFTVELFAVDPFGQIARSLARWRQYRLDELAPGQQTSRDFELDATEREFYRVAYLALHVDPERTRGEGHVENNYARYDVRDASGDRWRGDLVVEQLHYPIREDPSGTGYFHRAKAIVRNVGMTDLALLGTRNGAAAIRVRYFDAAGDQLRELVTAVGPQSYPWYPGAAYTAWFGYVPEEVIAATKRIVVEVDTSNRLVESDETNNARELTF